MPPYMVYINVLIFTFSGNWVSLHLQLENIRQVLVPDIAIDVKV